MGLAHRPRPDHTTAREERHRLISGRFGAALAVLALVLLVVGAIVAHASQTAFPGINGKIAFGGSTGGSCASCEIVVMNADGTNQVNLTNDPAADQGPVWSPDGTKIAFDSGRDGDEEVWVMNADGSNLTNVTNNSVGDSPSSWSPDGAEILFGSDRDGNAEIYVMNADGSGQTRLTNNPASETEPVFSPDGAKIAFTTYKNGDAEIFAMNADGTNPTNLTNSPSSNDGSPDWSPDGSKIAFDSSRDNPAGKQIYVMDADGANQTRLTFNASGFNAWPAWSPDGSMITFTSNQGPNPNPSEIYVINADGTGETRLTNNSANDQVSDWQPTVTPGSLCQLTKQFITSSARYQALPPALRAAIDKLANALCAKIALIVPSLSPAQKAKLVLAYQQGVAALVPKGWLTQAQANILVYLSKAL